MSMEIQTIAPILTERLAFKPFQYQWAYDYWFKQQNAHWLHTEISMNDDVVDWNSKLTIEEKNVIGNILKGFTQSETEISNYWSALIPEWFPVPEIKMMAITFGAFETIHTVAYSYLNDTLGLTDFEAFMKDEATMNKLNVLMSVRKDHAGFKPRDIALSIAIFSAAAEGIQLFSSFAVLLSFKLTNRLKGIGKQMEFSVRDESLHSEAGCKMFRTLMSEMPEINDDRMEEEVKHGIEMALTQEFAYIDKIFELGDLKTINKAQLKNFMYDRANKKLTELGYKGKYQVDKELLEQMKWFYLMVSGTQQTDFFANRESTYSKPNIDWQSNDLF